MKITPEKAQKTTPSSRPLPTECRITQERLGSFLDNELGGLQATRIVTHLQDCAACQRERRRLNELRAALRALPQKSEQETEAARGRVMARLERAVLQERPSSGRFPAGRRWAAARPVAGAFAAAAALAFALLILTRPGGRTPTVMPSSNAISVALPDLQEITTLSHLHDAHGATTAYDEPVARRDMSAAAHADMLEVAEATVAGSM